MIRFIFLANCFMFQILFIYPLWLRSQQLDLMQIPSEISKFNRLKYTQEFVQNENKDCKNWHILELHNKRFITFFKVLPLSTTSIGWNYNWVPPFRNVFFNPLQNSWLCIQIIHGNIKKSLQRIIFWCSYYFLKAFCTSISYLL